MNFFKNLNFLYFILKKQYNITCMYYYLTIPRSKIKKITSKNVLIIKKIEHLYIKIYRTNI